MEIVKTYYKCDRCKKEISEDEVNEIFYNMYDYQLCDECEVQYIEFDTKVQKLKDKYEKLEKEYKFGKYLPIENDKENK